MNTTTKKITVSALCLALCMVLPFLTGQIPQVGKLLLPMHFPVFICGFICGAPYAAIVGVTAPLLRLAIFHMPPLPVAIPMAFELMTYGFVSGVLYSSMHGRKYADYISLAGAMLAGRVVWGAASACMMLTGAKAFSVSAFIAGGFVNAIPGIILQFLIIPPIVRAVNKAGK